MVKFFDLFQSFIIEWYPWVIFFSENLLLQLFLIYTIYLIFTSLNLYYTLLYLFLEITLFGLFLNFYQLELFSGFLWVVEGTVIFIALILLFYLVVEFNLIKLDFQIYKFFNFFGIILASIVMFCSNFFNSSTELYLPQIFYYLELWDDYYEALWNKNMNDFLLLFISYYEINSIEFLLIGLFLLFGSVVCVNLNKLQKSLKLQKLPEFLKIFNLFEDFISFIFLRKQNLHDQTITPVSLRLFRKKKKN